MRVPTFRGIVLALALGITMVAGSPWPAESSDHADPMVLKHPDANITDLFFFPDGDRYVIIFDVRRALTAPPPYMLEKYEYRLSFDLHTPIGLEDDSKNARYGGNVNASTLKEDRFIQILLKNDGTENKVTYHKDFGDPSAIQFRAGVFDDPFIFPRFFKKNAVAMIFSIPKSAFPPDQQTFIVWGAAFKDGKQVDHVGRSNRTQQARFEPLNTLPPGEHLDTIMKRMNLLDPWVKRLNEYRQTQPIAGALQILLQIRKYDLVPDVLVYSTQFPDAVYSKYFPADTPGGFPNGRRLQDDVAARTCAVGDCILQELSFVEGDWPRRTTNDKTFLKTFPYLAEPWKEGEFKATVPLLSIWSNWWVRLAVVVTILIAALVIYYVILGIKYQFQRRRRLADAVL